MNNKGISIIIPAKNEEKYIGDCIAHLKKSLKSWGGKSEIILVDNGSTDDTTSIARKNNIKIYIEKDGNIGQVRNIGANKAMYDVIGFIDADCLVDEKWASYCMKHMKNREIAVFGTPAVPNPKNSTWVQKTIYKLISGIKRPKYVKWIGTSNFAVKKNVFYEVGGFDVSLKTAEDVELCHRINKKYKIYLENLIFTIHLRESKTIREMFNREKIRGSNSLESFYKGNFSKYELLSVLVPIINLTSLISMSVFIFFNIRISLLFAVTSLFMPLFYVIKKKPITNGLSEKIQCYIIALTYINARTVALVNEIREIIKRFTNI